LARQIAGGPAEAVAVSPLLQRHIMPRLYSLVRPLYGGSTSMISIFSDGGFVCSSRAVGLPVVGGLFDRAPGMERRSGQPHFSQLSLASSSNGFCANLSQAGTKTRPWGLSESATPPTLLSFCGGGVFMWWQLGVAKLLRERYDLSRTQMIGASGGAIAATLTACGVSAEAAVAEAMSLAASRGLLDTPLGTLGVWGKQLRDWLHAVLPPEAANLCGARVRLLVTELPRFTQRALGGFTCRDDLIDVNLASAHVPFVLDYRLATWCRGRWVLDGGIQDWLLRSRSRAISQEGAILIDHHADAALACKRMDLAQPLRMDVILALVDQGYRYGERQADEGQYARLRPLPGDAAAAPLVSPR